MNSLLRPSRFLLGLFAAWLASIAIAQGETAAEATYIVQGASLDAARTEVRRVGAEPERELDIIHAVAVRLTPAQVARLRANADVRVFDGHGGTIVEHAYAQAASCSGVKRTATA